MALDRNRQSTLSLVPSPAALVFLLGATSTDCRHPWFECTELPEVWLAATATFVRCRESQILIGMLEVLFHSSFREMDNLGKLLKG